MGPFTRLLFFVFYVSSSLAFAQNPEPSRDTGACPVLKTPTDVVRCAIEHGPLSRVNQLSNAAQTQAVDVSRQRLNPLVSAEYVPLTNGGRRAEVALLHTFELGGKRGARIAAAEVARDLGQKQVLLGQEELVISIVRDLYLLRQKKEEASLLQESSDTFKNIFKTYKRRLRLSPEQEVSLSVFEIAAEENALRLSRIMEERVSLIASLATRLQIDKNSLSDTVLPPLKTSWPQLAPDRLNNATSQILSASTRQAEAEARRARSESWPDLSVGPKLELENSNGVSDTRIGVVVSLPLPIFHRNAAGRAFAEISLECNRLESAYGMNVIRQDRDSWLRLYEASRNSIQRSLETTKLQQRHKSLHGLITQGLVGASEVIELHRQIFDYQEALHQQEVQGVEAQWRLLALDGKLMEGEVK